MGKTPHQPFGVILMSIHSYQAPSLDEMRRACLRARQYWHQRFPDVAIRLHVEEVPQFVPGMGAEGESYRIGALLLVAANQYLTVYLNAVTGRIQVEQPLLDVPDEP
jgi:hypothetical protein